ncbi:hypothetical protein ANCDUO_26541, partial [Ancylostoma duodenale]
TGYEELDELMRDPRPLRFIFHLLSVTQPEEYEAEGWQLTSEEKIQSVETLRLQGNELFSQTAGAFILQKKLQLVLIDLVILFFPLPAAVMSKKAYCIPEHESAYSFPKTPIR